MVRLASVISGGGGGTLFFRTNRCRTKIQRIPPISKTINPVIIKLILRVLGLNYDHQLRIININNPVTITGTSMLLQADTMTYTIEKEIIKCYGNVKGSFIGNIQ